MLQRIKQGTDTLSEIAVYYALIMIVSGIMFSYVENVPIDDSLYWAGVTMTTVGYGDISAHTDIGKILSVTLANISIFFLAPLVVVRMIEHLVDNRDHFSHDEQESIKHRLANIEDLLRNISDKK